MGHDHTEDRNAYYLEQLCTIGICGALGGVAIMMYNQDLLKYILAEKFNLPGDVTLPFHVMVFIGGISLLVLVVVRAVALWFSVAEVQASHAHPHDHGHGHDHDHSHAHDHGHSHHHHDCCGHDHEHDHHHDHDHEHAAEGPPPSAHHDHDHGWNPWRYAILLLPIVLYFLNLPNQGFSQDYLKRQLGAQLEDNSIVKMEQTGEIKLLFPELEAAAYTPQKRAYYEGKIGSLKGQFVAGGSDKEFTLFRLKITCCAADVIPLMVRIVSPESITNIKTEQWVEVTGQIQFRKLKDRDEYAPVLQLRSRDEVVPIDPPSNPYLQ